MPIREYRCPECGSVWDELFFGEYPKTKRCECGAVGEYRMGAAVFRIDFRDGWDSGAGQYFDSARQRDTFLDASNLRKNPDGVFEQEFGEKVKHGEG